MERPTPADDAWDWPALMYVATVMLRRSEGQFWRMTPRKFNALVKAHIEINGSSNKEEETGFIDQIF